MKRAVSARAGMVAALLVSGCATHGKPPPDISLDTSGTVAAHQEPDPPRPVQVVEVPKPLPLPDQLKPLPDTGAGRASAREQAREPGNPAARVERANRDARMPPTLDGYINAIQVWPYSEGALYQVYTSPGRVTVIALEAGETLVSMSAGDTVRWVVGNTTSGSGANQRVNVMIKPVRAGLKTNLVITTNRRTYLLELTSTQATWIASVSWDYPEDLMLNLQRQAQQADAAVPVATGLSLDRLRFRYQITGDNPPWRPLRAFDDGEHVYIEFPDGIAQGELPPLFVIGAQGDAELVNYRYRAPYYVVDRLFGAAELRLGAKKQQVVRISRTDGRANGWADKGMAVRADNLGRSGS